MIRIYIYICEEGQLLVYMWNYLCYFTPNTIFIAFIHMEYCQTIRPGFISIYCLKLLVATN